LSIFNSLSSDAVMLENTSKLIIYDVKFLESNGTLRTYLSINSDAQKILLHLPEKAGIYFMEVKTNKGNYVFKVIKT
jgi:hypothetical protein